MVLDLKKETSGIGLKINANKTKVTNGVIILLLSGVTRRTAKVSTNLLILGELLLRRRFKRTCRATDINEECRLLGKTWRELKQIIAILKTFHEDRDPRFFVE